MGSIVNPVLMNAVFSAALRFGKRSKKRRFLYSKLFHSSGMPKMICVSVFSATRYLLRRMNVAMTKPTAQQTTHRHVPRV